MYSTLGLINGYSSILNGVAKSNSIKAQGYADQAQVYNNFAPQAKLITQQAAQLSSQQAIAYMNSGVDVSKGTAQHTIQNTIKQAQERTKDLWNATEKQVSSIKSMTDAQAQAAVWEGVSAAAVNIADGYSKQKYHDRINYVGNNNNNTKLKSPTQHNPYGSYKDNIKIPSYKLDVGKYNLNLF
ncbi:MAG: hypothetical protein LBH46_01385 [Rickettsiales bacterium]|jgi:hypothetical protein|nr:hypothetical protein [Rickettsiales bacterium]